MRLNIINYLLGIAVGNVDVPPAVGHIVDPYFSYGSVKLQFEVIPWCEQYTRRSHLLPDIKVYEPVELRHE